MKFSIIVPVYNVENYVEKCLESIFKQSYQNYEVIIVDDGSTDHSDKIIKNFIKGKEKFHYYKKENGGLSDARNFGLEYVSGDYILFIDSDDYINKDLLKKINIIAEKNMPDIIRYELTLVNENGKTIKKVNNNNFKNSNLEECINSIVTSAYVEPAWLYAYKKDFWFKNHFLYPYGKIHEDFGLTLIILSKAKKIEWINYNGYFYVQRKNSIMNQVEYPKLKKRTEDLVDQYLNNIQVISNNSYKNKLILNYCTTTVIYKLREVNEEDRNKLIKKLKQARFLKYYYVTSFKNLLLKIYLFIFLKHHIKNLHEAFLKGE